MRRTVPLAVVGWLAAAVAATATGVVAVTLIGQGLNAPQTAVPLTEAEVASALASPAATRAVPTATPAPSPTLPRGEARSLTTPGGTVTATCSGGLATLLSWAPAQGYAVGEVDAGPDDSPKVRFERGERRIEVRVRCGAGGPYTEVKED